MEWDQFCITGKGCCRKDAAWLQRDGGTETGRWQVEGKGAGWGEQSWEGKTNLRPCTCLWQLPHPTTRCHQTQNPLETRLRKKPGNLNPKNNLDSVPAKS